MEKLVATNPSSSKNSKEVESIKPFKLVKYLSIVGLCILLAGAFVFSSFIATRAKRIVLRKSEESAALLAKNLNYRVVKDFILAVLATEGEVRLSRPEQYKRLDQIVRNTVHGFPVEEVNIYDLLGVLTYSTSQDEILGSKRKIGEPFRQALKGEVVSVFDGGRSFLGFEWPWGDRKRTLTTYIPMWVGMIELESHQEIMGTVAVFEIIQDISTDYEKIFGFQWIVVLSVTIFVAMLLSTLLFFARRAEKIIERRAMERLRLRERLQRAEHLATLGEMIASVSHEIKNPLGIIHSTASLMKGRLEGDKNQRLAKIIVDEAMKLNNIVTEFLDFARPKDPQFVTFVVEDFLDESISLIELQSRERGVEIEKKYRNGSLKSTVIQGDPMLLNRVFYNLFLNALQSMTNGGRLAVDVESNGLFCSIKVSDTGSGIPEELRDKIFWPFFTTKEKGTGLGLAIVKSIVETHNGEIFVESEENKGTTVIVKIPFRNPQERSSPLS